MCREEGITPLQLIKWIRTRWGSMHDLIKRLLATKAVCHLFLSSMQLLICPQAVNKFCQLADESPKVPDLTRGRKYADYKLEKEEWKLLKLMGEVLEVRLLRPSSLCDVSRIKWTVFTSE